MNRRTFEQHAARRTDARRVPYVTIAGPATPACRICGQVPAQGATIWHEGQRPRYERGALFLDPGEWVACAPHGWLLPDEREALEALAAERYPASVEAARRLAATGHVREGTTPRRDGKLAVTFALTARGRELLGSAGPA